MFRVRLRSIIRRKMRGGSGGGKVRQGGPGCGMEEVVVEEVDSADEVGVRVEVGKRRKVVRRGRFCMDSASVGEFDVDGFSGSEVSSSVESGVFGLELSARVVAPTPDDTAETPCG